MTTERRNAGGSLRPFPGGERGAAVTELVVLMVALVPMILFTMFVSDAMYHQLEAQEAVIATVWDFSTRGFGRATTSGSAQGVGNNIKDQVQTFNRAQFADHSSAYIDESQLTASGGGVTLNNTMYFHTQPFAQVSWMGGSDGSSYTTSTSSQITCQYDRDQSAEDYKDPTANEYRDNWSAGGIVECWGKEWLYNYVIESQFLNSMANFGQAGDQFDKTLQTSSNVDSLSGSTTTDILLKDRAGILADSWAQEPGTVGGGSDNVNVASQGDVDLGQGFYNRAESVFASTRLVPVNYAMAATAVGDYFRNAKSQNLGLIGDLPTANMLMVGILPNAAGFFMAVQHEAYNAGPDDSAYKINGYYTTPMYDNDLTVFDSRGKYYLADKTFEDR
jgi:hypothetical protein